MSKIQSKNALLTMGQLFITISFRVYEVKREKVFISDGQSSFVYNVFQNRERMKNKAIYDAIKREFPNRTVTAYDVHILDYYYEYYIDDYEIIKNDGKSYESYTSVETGTYHLVEKDKHNIKQIVIKEYNNDSSLQPYKGEQ